MRASRLLTAAIAASLAAAAVPAARGASVPVPPPSFGAVPQANPALGPRAYFAFDLAPGATASDGIVVENSSGSPETLRIGASSGATAVGSGDAFVGAFEPCRGAACWVSGLPAEVTLAAHERRTIPFTVHVPAGSPQRQYLAGITIQPGGASAPVTVGSNGSAGASAVIVHQVNVGVAVTVGTLSQLRSSLSITSVTATLVGSTPRLLVREKNTGETFLHARGGATCTSSGQSYTFTVASGTILPGDTAVLTVNAPNLAPGGASHCTLQLQYPGGSASRWKGEVAVPAVRQVTRVHTGPGAYSTLPASAGTPTWAVALIAVGAVLVALLLALVAVLAFRLRRRGGRDAAPESREHHARA